MIILATQGLGKSYAASILDGVKDIDIMNFRGDPESYADALIKASDDDNIALGNISAEIMSELNKRGEKFLIFAPVFSKDFTKEEAENYMLLKEIIFGRLVLRKTQNERNVAWLEKVKRNFDSWCDIDFFTKYVSQTEIRPMTLSVNNVASLLSGTKPIPTYCKDR